MSTEKDRDEARERMEGLQADYNNAGHDLSELYQTGYMEGFVDGCQHVRQGEREMLKRLARYCYDNMSLYLSRDDDDRFVDEFLEQEKSNEQR